MAWALLIPFRNLYLSPSKLAARLELKPDHTVLELGCGPGYFSPSIAKRITDGKLFLMDIQPEMIEKARRRLERKHIVNVELSVCDGTALPYPDGMFDRIFLVTVLGEISHRSQYAREMFRVLRPGGIVSVSEQGGDPDCLSVEDVQNILRPAGFVLDRIYGRGRTYTANFRKI
jgi:ubiquinone/menaquinone biosynthesis C-methylase UbiE